MGHVGDFGDERLVVATEAVGQYEQTSILAAIAYRIIPNVGPFWIIDGLQAGTVETIVPLSYVGYVTCYALLLTTGIICIAIAAFQRRELG